MADLTNKYIYETYPSIVGIGEQGSSGVTNSLKPLTDGVGELLPIEVSKTEVNIKATNTQTVNLSIAAYGEVINEAGEWVGPGSSTGTSGTSGSSGINGSSGSAGSNGTSGTDGIDGTSGINGISGTNGTSGTSAVGSSGTNGTSGTNGSSGTNGTSGTNGVSSGRLYYFNQSQASDVSPYRVISDVPVITTQQTISKTLTNIEQNVLVQEFLTPELGFTLIPAGPQTFHLHFSFPAAAADIDTYVSMELANADGIGYGAIATSTVEKLQYNDGEVGIVMPDIIFPATTINATDRMIVKIYVNNNDNTSRSVVWYTQDGYYSYVTTTVSAASGTSGTSGSSGTNGSAAPAGLVNGTGINSLKQDNALTTTDATAAGDNSIALGTGANTIYDDAIAIGNNARSTFFQTIAIGKNAWANNGVASIAIGENSKTTGYNQTAIGQEAQVNNSSAEQSMALGYFAKINAAVLGATALGAGVVADKDYTVSMKALDLQTPSTPSAGGIIMTDAGSTERRINVTSTGGLQVDSTPVVSSAGPNAIGNIWSGTQAQYDALGTYSATTLYFID